MSGKCLPEDKKKILEKEFSEFLTERIKHAGGSLQIHHLSGLLQQARFEIRDAFGTTKSELMKFLKVHPKIFQIDSVGVVSITSSVSSDDSYDSDTCAPTARKSTSLPEIEGGIGIVIKLYPEFGIIKAVKPVETEVHFQSETFCENKDSLLTDSGLEIGNEVYFNAVHGHEDYDIKYRASKVWFKFDLDATSDNNGGNNAVSNNLQGEGIIQKIFPNLGFILVFGREDETVYFSKNTVSDCDDMELTKFLKVGDPVEFSAFRSDRRDSRAQWQATIVTKKSNVNSKHNVQPPSDTKKKVSVRTTIENEPGKICPHSHGAIIKFGNNYSELADGDSSSYFLYGAEVSDINWEFSEGDDVWFDAIKTKTAPGWKAISVWVGEKPACANGKMFTNEEMNEFSDNSCVSSTEITAERLRSKAKKSLNDASVPKPEMRKKNKEFDPSVKREVSQPDLEFKKQNPKSSKSLQSYSTKKLMSKKGDKKPGKENSSVNKNKINQRSAMEIKKTYKSNHIYAPVKKHAAARCQSNTELDEISSYCDDYDDHSYKDNVSDISQGSLQDDEFQGILNYDKNLLMERGNNIESSSKYNFVNCEENDMDNKCNEMKCYKTTDKKKSSIKKFEDIDGEIVNLYCKAAIVKSPQLQRNVDFVLNVFYINGKSVEEQQVIDLKEIVKVGDHVNFNCFEIRDDKGEIHVKVTMAWKGPKPVVYEMTPEEFIDVYQLSVTISDECSSDQRTASQDSLAEVLNSEATEYCSSNSSEDVSDAQLKMPEAHLKEKLDEKDLLVDVHHRLLSDVIIHRLKSKGFISADLQVDLSGVLTPIISLVRQHCNECESFIVNEEVNKNSKIPEPVCLTCSERRGSAFSIEKKSEKHAAVQTIITGGIVAQNDDLSEKLKFNELH